MKQGKKHAESRKMIDTNKVYTTTEAIELLKKASYTKFDATVEIAVKTNANPRFNDQMIRSTTILPHGTGKTKRVAVYVTADKLEEAKKSGADVYGNEDLLNNLKAGKFDFDILVTTPDAIRELAPVAKTLGPKGLMPSPKAGTVTTNLAQTVEEIKKGKVEFRLDKTGNIHAAMGKLSFDNTKLIENIESFVKAILDNRPTGVKGKLIKKIVISSTMSPGIQLESME